MEGGGTKKEKDTKVSKALLTNKYKVVRELPRGGQSRIFVVHSNDETHPEEYLVVKEMARR